MKRKFIIYFVILVLVLAASEYIFLVELNGPQRTYILLLTTLMAVASIVGIFLCYKRFGKDI